MPMTFTVSNFEAEVEQSTAPVLIDFWAPWCGPCRMVGPVVEQLETELAGTVKVGKVNVDEEPDLAARFGVMSIPTLIVIKDGKVVSTAVGARPKEDLKRILGL